jgi:hypothetical protein
MSFNTPRSQLVSISMLTKNGPGRHLRFGKDRIAASSSALQLSQAIDIQDFNAAGLQASSQPLALQSCKSASNGFARNPQIVGKVEPIDRQTQARPFSVIEFRITQELKEKNR